MMLAVTHAGSARAFPYWIAGALLIALFRPALMSQLNAAAFALGFAATGVLLPWLKSAVDFPRPVTALGRDLVIVVGPDSLAASFPSGHAAFVVLMAATLGPGTSPPIQWALWIFAAVVGFSRVAVGAHFPADIAGGALLGLAVGIIVRTALESTYDGDMKRADRIR